MTDNNQSNSQADTAGSRWVDDAQAALDRTVAAIRTAWDSTKDSRTEALESAKQAAEDLGKVIDQGVAAARERWSGRGEDTEMAEERDIPSGQ